MNPANKTTACTVEPYFVSDDGRFLLYYGDCSELLPVVGAIERPNVIFADPPYFLSDGGTTCRGGKRVSVDKGDWDKASGVSDAHAFNVEWLTRCKDVLHPDGTIWVSGTLHNIYSIGFAMQQLGFRILNNVTWQKTAPPPNLGCRCFTHSTETVIWAARDDRSKRTFHYKDMKNANGGKQMKDVWTIGRPKKAEKKHEGPERHPTQKPEALLDRILRASASPGDLVLDPFNGSGTTGVAAARLGLRYVGIDQNEEYLAMTVRRIREGWWQRRRIVYPR